MSEKQSFSEHAQKPLVFDTFKIRVHEIECEAIQEFVEGMVV